MAKDYIPRADSEFFNFQGTLIKRAADNAAGWNIPAPVMDKIQSSGAAYELIYQKASNKAFRNTSQVKSHRQKRIAYEKEIRTFVNGFLAHNPALGDADKSGMRLRVRGKRPRSRPAITTAPMASMHPLGGGFIEISCREETDASRDSVHPHANGIYMSYKIGGEQPLSVNDCTNNYFSTRARFIFQAGPQNEGKKLFAYFRWENTVDTTRSGPWNNLRQGVIA